MGRSHIYDLLWETCHRALKQMWKQPSHEYFTVYFPEDREWAVHSFLYSLPDGDNWEDKMDMQLREREGESSIGLVDVGGHLVSRDQGHL